MLPACHFELSQDVWCVCAHVWHGGRARDARLACVLPSKTTRPVIGPAAGGGAGGQGLM